MIDSLIDNVEQEQQPNSEQIADITMSNPAIGNTTVSSSIVYNMDCVEGMKHYPDKYFDLAVVDPPYVMLGNTFRIKNKKFTNGFVSSAMDKGKDAKIEFGLRPTIEYFSELYRVSKNQIIWGMQYFVEYLLPHQCVLLCLKYKQK